MSQDPTQAADRTCPAAVAYDLMRDILFEDPARPVPSSPEFRAYMLDLYAECLLAVRGKRAQSAPQPASARGKARQELPPQRPPARGPFAELFAGGGK